MARKKSLAIRDNFLNKGVAAGDIAMIIETTCNHLYFVVETGDENLSHLWNGLRVKRVKGGFIVTKNAKRELVRKEGCRKVADFAALKGAA